MNSTPSQHAGEASGGALPTYQQIVTLALARAERDLESLVNTRSADEHWNDDDVDVDYAVELSLAHIQRMKQKEFKKGGDENFAWEWWMAAAPINMAVKLFSRRDCLYWRRLDGLQKMFEPVASMVELAEA